MALVLTHIDVLGMPSEYTALNTLHLILRHLVIVVWVSCGKGLAKNYSRQPECALA